MNYKNLDMELYKRKSHFEYFNSLSYPYVGVTVNVDITEMLKKVKAEKLPFFLTLCYCVAKAANEIPQFRQRIVDDTIIEYDVCTTSHTVALEDETYCYCTLNSDKPFDEYIPYATRKQAEAKENRMDKEGDQNELDKFFITTLPWFSYTSFAQPVPMPADSNPRISWGRYFTQEGKVLLPLSVLCHHALVDGVHIANFYKELDSQIASIVKF